MSTSRAAVSAPDGEVLWSNGRRMRPPKHPFEPQIDTKPYELPKQPARYSMPKLRATRRLVLRSEASLDSDRCGVLEPGTSVLLIEAKGNTGRVRIGECRAQGVRPLGWVTQEKDGEVYLRVVEEASPPGGALSLRGYTCSPTARAETTRLSTPTHDRC